MRGPQPMPSAQGERKVSDHELNVLRLALECLEWHISAGSFGCDIEGVAGELRSVIENQVAAKGWAK